MRRVRLNVLFMSVPCNEVSALATPALGALPQRVINEHDRKKSFGDRRCADAYARIVPPERLHRGGFALYGDGLALDTDAGSGFDGQRHGNGLAGRNAAQHAPCMVT